MKDFSCLITDQLPDLEIVGKNQCFPLYWYESRADYEKSHEAQKSLFGEEVAADGFDEYGYRRHDGITNYMLGHVCHRYGVKDGVIDKEMIFYAVYSLLHNKDWRTKYAANLKKELPRIALPDNIDLFLKEVSKGRALANLHLNYEAESAPQGVVIKHLGSPCNIGDIPLEHLEVQKMRFPSKEQKDVIVFNEYITIENIPPKAYEYIVNGKSAIEWVMERYAITLDKASEIVNNPNLWSTEHSNPQYILQVLLGVIGISVKTVEILEGF
jgi:predicted helicase